MWREKTNVCFRWIAARISDSSREIDLLQHRHSSSDLVSQQQKLTSFDGDAVGPIEGLFDGDTEGNLLGLLEGLILSGEGCLVWDECVIREEKIEWNMRCDRNSHCFTYQWKRSRVLWWLSSRIRSIRLDQGLCCWFASDRVLCRLTAWDLWWLSSRIRSIRLDRELCCWFARDRILRRLPAWNPWRLLCWIRSIRLDRGLCCWFARDRILRRLPAWNPWRLPSRIRSWWLGGWLYCWLWQKFEYRINRWKVCSVFTIAAYLICRHQGWWVSRAWGSRLWEVLGIEPLLEKEMQVVAVTKIISYSSHYNLEIQSVLLKENH